MILERQEEFILGLESLPVENEKAEAKGCASCIYGSSAANRMINVDLRGIVKKGEQYVREKGSNVGI